MGDQDQSLILAAKLQNESQLREQAEKQLQEWQKQTTNSSETPKEEVLKFFANLHEETYFVPSHCLILLSFASFLATKFLGSRVQSSFHIIILSSIFNAVLITSVRSFTYYGIKTWPSHLFSVVFYHLNYILFDSNQAGI